MQGILERKKKRCRSWRVCQNAPFIQETHIANTVFIGTIHTEKKKKIGLG